MDYDIDKYKLILGDCLDVMKDIPDNSVDMVFCDMPYGTTRNKWDIIIPLEPLWEQYKRICKPNAAIVLTAQTPFDKVLGASNISWLRYEWIWEKTKPTGHLNAKKMPMKAHENVLVFYKYSPTYNPIKTTGHKPVNSYTKHSTDGSNYGQTKLGIKGGGSTDRYPRSVITIPSDTQKSSISPTQKPVALSSYMIKTYTNPGDVVLDNCMGSGSTGISCLDLGRYFIGIEKDKEEFMKASFRVKNHLVV